MPTPPLSDDLAREAIEAWLRNGRSGARAAQELGINKHTLDSRIRIGKQRGLHLSEGARGVVSMARLSGTEARGGWLHSYDEDGKKIGATYWRAPDDDALLPLADRIRAALEGIEPAPVIPGPSVSDDDTLTVYPLADVHIGMRAWGKETGEDYDTDIAGARVRDWVGRAVDAAPASGQAVILGVGDLTHADDHTNQTPQSKHVLDVDSRHFRTLEATIAALAYGVEYAARKHPTVTVRVLPGNHDINTYLAVMFALAERYRSDPRVHVQTVPGEFWVQRFGACLFAAHHGHRAKPERIVMALADEHAEEWGQTRHRFLWTGHLHHLKAADIGGVQWEQLRAVTARDAYAVSNSYVARAQLQAITFHKEHGEIQRVKVSG